MEKRGRPDPHWFKVGDRVRALFPAAVVEAEVIEDRGALGVGGRQIVTVRTINETEFPALMEFRADEIELMPRGEEAA